jgi:hypothetical protein
MTEPTLRPYRDPEDREAFFELFRKIYGTEYGDGVDRDRAFDWMYRQSGDGRLLSTGAFAGDRLAAFYGIVPLRFRVDGQDLMGAQSLDSMTHPDFQRRGLFAKLGNLAYRETCREVPVVFGFPNESALPPRVARLGWVALRPVPRFVLMLQAPPLPTSLQRPGVGRLLAVAMGAARWRIRMAEWGALVARRWMGLDVSEEPVIPADVDDLWQEVRDDYRVSVVRDAAYLRWRYDQHPSKAYRRWTIRQSGRLRGILITRQPVADEPDLHAVEWLAPADRTVQLAMAESLAMLARTGQHRAAFVLNSFRPTDVAALVAVGFLPLPKGQTRPWLVPGVRANGPQATADALYHVDHWRLSYGDMDMG